MDKREKQSYWKNHIDQWHKSSLRQVDYCETNKIPLSTFSYWKRKLNNNDQNKPVFYPLALSSQQPNSNTPKGKGLTLYLKEGRFSIEIDDGFSPSTLSQVVTTLEQL